MEMTYGCGLWLRSEAQGQQSVVKVGRMECVLRVPSETGWKEVRLPACWALKDRRKNLCATLMCDECLSRFPIKRITQSDRFWNKGTPIKAVLRNINLIVIWKMIRKWK